MISLAALPRVWDKSMQRATPLSVSSSSGRRRDPARIARDARGRRFCPSVFSGSPKARTAVGGVPERPNAAATKRAAKDADRYAAGHDTGRPELPETIVTIGRPTSRRSCDRSRRCRSEPTAAWPVCVSATSPAQCAASADRPASRQATSIAPAPGDGDISERVSWGIGTSAFSFRRHLVTDLRVAVH